MGRFVYRDILKNRTLLFVGKKKKKNVQRVITFHVIIFQYDKMFFQIN